MDNRISVSLLKENSVLTKRNNELNNLSTNKKNKNIIIGDLNKYFECMISDDLNKKNQTKEIDQFNFFLTYVIFLKKESILSTLKFAKMKTSIEKNLKCLLKN